MALRHEKLLFALWAGLAFSLSGFADFERSALSELSGFGLKVREPSVRSERFELHASLIDVRAREAIKALALPLVSEEVRETLPGKPYLEIAVEVAQAQGPSHLYLVALDLRERAVLERPEASRVLVAASSWGRSFLGVANRPEAVLEAVDRLIRIFAREYAETNGSSR